MNRIARLSPPVLLLCLLSAACASNRQIEVVRSDLEEARREAQEARDDIEAIQEELEEARSEAEEALEEAEALEYARRLDRKESRRGLLQLRGGVAGLEMKLFSPDLLPTGIQEICEDFGSFEAMDSVPVGARRAAEGALAVLERLWLDPEGRNLANKVSTLGLAFERDVVDERDASAALQKMALGEVMAVASVSRRKLETLFEALDNKATGSEPPSLRDALSPGRRSGAYGVPSEPAFVFRVVLKLEELPDFPVSTVTVKRFGGQQWKIVSIGTRSMLEDALTSFFETFFERLLPSPEAERSEVATGRPFLLDVPFLYSRFRADCTTRRGAPTIRLVPVFEEPALNLEKGETIYLDEQLLGVLRQWVEGTLNPQGVEVQEEG